MSTIFRTINGTTVFYARNVRKAFQIEKQREGFVRVAEVDGITGEILSINRRKRYTVAMRAYVRKCWSGSFTPLQFEVTH